MPNTDEQISTGLESEDINLLQTAVTGRTLTFDELVLEDSLAITKVRVLPKGTRYTRAANDKLLTELQCEV